VQDFEKYLEEHKDDITALQVFYAQPYRARVRYRDIKDLAEKIKAPPRNWTPDRLWRAYGTLYRDKVRGASGQRILSDIVSILRFALHKEDERVPFADRVKARFGNWMAQQESSGRKFSGEQLKWLEMIRDHVAISLGVTIDDFDYQPFVQEGGLGKARQVFGGELPDILRELNEELAA